MSANPLLETWTGPYGLPPFDTVRAEHFGPALDAAMAAHGAEIRAIADSASAPDFRNTILALDESGALLKRVSALFHNLASSRTDAALKAVEAEYSPRLALHYARLLLDPALFARVDAVAAGLGSSDLGSLERRLVERTHLDFTRAGARLAGPARARMEEVAEALAERCTTFGQNVLADEEEWFLELSEESELAGLPAGLVAGAAEAARALGKEGKWCITLARSFVDPFLTFSTRRDLRKKVYEAFVDRGELRADRDTKPLIREILALRAEKAALLGYPTYADFALEDRMAARPRAVMDLLEKVWKPALAKAREEEARLLAFARRDGLETLEAWDWRHYAEKVRSADYSLDGAEIKAYFGLDDMMKAMFRAAGRLFGLSFVEVKGSALYHEDVRLFEVRDAGGALKGIYLADNFARPGKRSGAWMSNYRDQSKGVIPIVVNNTNFTKGARGESVRIGLDDLRTLFHEFGHALHGLLSDVDYEGLSGTSTLRDFVELPSQLFEHWALVPAILAEFALHEKTGEAIPEALVARIKKAATFNQGWETLQYLGPALLDMALHGLADPSALDPAAFERDECARLGLPAVVGLRHRLPHFLHLFRGDSYAAGYYVYMWAEVLEADAFAAFEEKGDVFEPALASRLRELYAAGNSMEPGALYRRFRGRDPSIEPLLRQRGLLG